MKLKSSLFRPHSARFAALSAHNKLGEGKTEKGKGPVAGQRGSKPRTPDQFCRVRKSEALRTVTLNSVRFANAQHTLQNS